MTASQKSLVESVREQAEQTLDPFTESPNIETFARDVLELLRRDEHWLNATRERKKLGEKAGATA